MHIIPHPFPADTRAALRRGIPVFLLIAVVILTAQPARGENTPLSVGVAQLDITPDYPVRLSGFGFRRTESEGITQRIWTKALAFADDKEGPAILITADNLCISGEISDEVAKRLHAKIGVKRERLCITATHTHTAPMLKNVAPALFGTPIPPEHQDRIDRYTRELLDKLEQVALAAVKDIRPARVEWGVGNAGFAVNRRTPGGPVDHDLSVLAVRDPDNKVRAIYFSYSCHCVTLSDNKISGDWAGFAQDAVQKLFPGAIALASVGCGADSNPRSGVTGGKVEACVQQGTEIAIEVQRLLTGPLRAITVKPSTRRDLIELPFDTSRTRAEWEQRSKSSDYAIAYHAGLNLGRLDRGEKLPASITYPIQSWIFGDGLAMIFLPGETVVDYSLRLKLELERARIWINGYSNDGRCYIPSERILKEGGYEGGGAMVYYDMPQRFAPGLEQTIIKTVHAQVPASFTAPKGTEGTRAVSPADSIGLLHTTPGLKIELVAAEPMIVDPVAIDWGRDGRLWVCEMHDYPQGLDENWQPGGRIKVLEDSDGDGRCDKATVFLDSLAFPTGITVWGRGAFICTAPDIIYAEDTDGDGKADKIDKIFSGFGTENFQARVNSLSLGLDNWIYGANGLLGGTIRGRTPDSTEVNIRNRDFRFDPFTNHFEPASGLTQQGRARDDWGNWFGCDNSTLLMHYPVPDHYLRRNPQLPDFSQIAHLTSGPDRNRLFPISRLQERYNDPDNANRVTSACGLGIYRDTLLGEEFSGNAFICEAVHNLVHREVLTRDGGRFTSHRADDGPNREFLSSTDNWFRPVQVRTGPDGALYVVDMYRFLIEHPRWIAAARLAKIDVRAGADMGRIYRIVPEGKPLRRVPDLKPLNGAELAAALDSPNGTERDRVHAELLTRHDPASIATLESLSSTAPLPQVRAQALCVLDGLATLKPELLQRALQDSDERVRQQGVRISERFLREPSGQGSSELGTMLLSLTKEQSPLVLEQLALTLGEWNDPRAAEALGLLAKSNIANERLRIAVLSSASRHCGAILSAMMSTGEKSAERESWIEPLIATALASGDEALFEKALAAALPVENAPPSSVQLRAVESVMSAVEEQKNTLAGYLESHADVRKLLPRLTQIVAAAQQLAADPKAQEPLREAAVKLTGHGPLSPDKLALLRRMATDPGSGKLRSAALGVLGRNGGSEIPEPLLEDWQQTSPVVRTEIVALLLSRDAWARALLVAIHAGRVSAAEVSLAQQQQLAGSKSDDIKRLAAETFTLTALPARKDVLDRYQSVISLHGTAAKGADIFARNCATCHRLGGAGFDVGPSLAPLRDKDADYWMKNILDPSAVIDPRFVFYTVQLKDNRSLGGVIKNETAGSLTVLMPAGISETVMRSTVQEIRAAGVSLMPAGIEQLINPQEMADLIAFLQSAAPSSKDHAERPDPVRASPNDVLRDAASVAKLILDSTQPDVLRETAVRSNPQFAADLIAEMTRDLKPGTPEEYVRIPWIWRVAVACGKRNDAAPIRRVLAASLPQAGEPLHDWQAVVIGGGIINGLSQRGAWPAARVAEILSTDDELRKRWAHALELASAMAGNEKIPAGTRYDALRMLGVEPWEKRGPQLVRYLSKSTDPELQQGAVSAVADIDAPQAAAALAAALPDLTESNRRLAIDALVRNDARIAALLDAITAGRIKASDLGEGAITKLKDHPNEQLRQRARSLGIGP